MCFGLACHQTGFLCQCLLSVQTGTMINWSPLREDLGAFFVAISHGGALSGGHAVVEEYEYFAPPPTAKGVHLQGLPAGHRLHAPHLMADGENRLGPPGIPADPSVQVVAICALPFLGCSLSANGGFGCSFQLSGYGTCVCG